MKPGLNGGFEYYCLGRVHGEAEGLDHAENALRVGSRSIRAEREAEVVDVDDAG